MWKAGKEVVQNTELREQRNKMSRRRKKRDHRSIKGDPIYDDETLSHFINKIMWDGEKEKARHIVYGAFKRIKEMESSMEPLTVFKKALDNCKPSLEVRSRRVGGATYQVPVEVRQSRRTSLAMRWLITHARNRKGKSISERLAGELMDACHNRGSSIKKKEDVHRMAESNRAFSHYNW